MPSLEGVPKAVNAFMETKKKVCHYCFVFYPCAISPHSYTLQQQNPSLPNSLTNQQLCHQSPPPISSPTPKKL